MSDANILQNTRRNPSAAGGIQDSFQKMIRQAYEIGPHTVLFIQELWREAVQEATWNSLNLFQLVRWYSVQRVEQAIDRAMRHGVRGIQGLRYILEEELDQLERREDAELNGQLLLPLGFPEAPENTRQSGNVAENAAFPRTGSRT